MKETQELLNEVDEFLENLSLNQWTNRVGKWAQRKGWNESPPEDGTFIALMHSELSEALEELRDGNDPNRTYFIQTKRGPKPEGVPSELADVIIRICHYAYLNDIDLGEIMHTKMIYNERRNYKHGREF